MMLVVLAAGFTSCSNDDIPLEEKVTNKVFDTSFIVNPSGVIESFKFERTPGALTTIPENAQLRLRLLIYDSKGDLVDIFTSKQSNYESSWSVKAQLEAGTYTAVALSDVINSNDSEYPEYWSLEGYEKITEMKLTKTPNALGYEKEVFGFSHIPFTIVDSNYSVSLNLKSAGAACYYYVMNYDSEPRDIWFQSNVRTNSVFWDSSYQLKYNRDIDDSAAIYQLGGVGGLPEYYDIMSFVYLLPFRNQYFLFVEELENGYDRVGQSLLLEDIKAGHQYFFMCFLFSGYENGALTEWYDVTGVTFSDFVEWYNRQMQSTYSRGLDVNNMNRLLMSSQITSNEVYIQDLIK